jgi:hypothetical protein
MENQGHAALVSQGQPNSSSLRAVTVTIAKTLMICAVPLKFAFQRFVTPTAVEEDSPLVPRKRTQPPPNLKLVTVPNYAK